MRLCEDKKNIEVNIVS